MKTAKNILEWVLVPAVLACCFSARAQLAETWAAHYTNSAGAAHAATVDTSGNMYITGSSANDVGTVKFDANGNLVWSASYSGRHGYNDGGNAITMDATGNVYVTGAVSGSRFYYFNGTTKTYLPDAVTVKYDSSGRQKWASSYSENGSGSYAGRAVAVDGAGNVYVAGSSFVVKYAANGHQTWVVTGVAGVAAALDSGGNLYVTGSGTRKLDANGTQLWLNNFGGAALALDGTGGVYVTGAGATKKLDAGTGAEVWSATLDGNGNALALDAARNVFVAGQFAGPSASGLGVVKYAPNGTNLWVTSTYSLGYYQYQGFSAAVSLDAGGNAYVTGLTYGGPFANEYLTLKYGPNGSPLWLGRHPGCCLVSLGLDAAGNVYVAGTETNAILALKYSQPAAAGMPQIQTQPHDTLAFIGGTASYSVTATGHGPLNYQWYYSGNLLPGMTDSSLSLTNVNPNNASGPYTVEVGDSFGLTLSTQANLVVVAPPASQSVLAGDDVEFDAWSFGSAPAGYRWQFNGADLPGQNGVSLVLAKVNAAQAGDYRVVASALGNSITSPPAHLAVETLVRQSWVAGYAGYDPPSAMRADAAGNVYVIGASANNGTDADYATVKYGADGRQLWAARYDGTAHGWDEARGLALDRLGNVYVTGVSFSIRTNGSSDQDVATIKYGPNGNQLWVARHNSDGNLGDGGQAVTVDDAGYVYVAAYSGSTNNGNDIVTVKYDNNGNQLWAARYDGPGHNNDLPHAIAVNATGNVYVTGESGGAGSDQDYATLKYDANGNLLWAVRYNGPGNSTDFAHRLAVDTSGNVFVSGSSIGAGTNHDIATLKYDANGQQIWLARYNGPANGHDNLGDLALDTAGNVYVTGWAHFTDHDTDYVTIKYGPTGQQLWVARYDGPSHGDDTANSLALDPSGNVYVTGTSQTLRMNSSGYVYGDRDYATVKYDASGRQIWIARFDGEAHADDIGQLLALDGAGNVCVSGYSSAYGSYGYVTLKYQQAGAFSLIITPPAGFSSGGSVGGPFSVTTQNFSLVNQGTATVGWRAFTDASWLSVSPANGALATGQPPATVSVSLNTAANDLSAGFYLGTVLFTNASNGFVDARQFALAIASSSYGGAVLALIPPAYWPLNETNYVPPANVVTNVGSLGGVAKGFSSADNLQGQPGIVGNSFRFSNPGLDAGYFGSHVDVPYNRVLNPSGPFSVELWAKPARVVSDLYCAAASVDLLQSATNSRFGWVCYQTPTNWEFRVGGGLPGYAAIANGGTVTTGAWNHVVGVYDGASLSLYVNGQLTGGPLAVSGFSPNTNSHIPLRLGATTFPNRTFDGWVDEVAFYTNSLGSARIAAHYNTALANASGYATQVLNDSPAGFWHLDEPVYIAPGALPAAVNLGFLREEANGIYEPGCLPGSAGVPSQAFGPSNTACRLYGAGYLAMPGALLDFTGPLSLVLWAKADPANGNLQTIASKGTGSYRLLMDGAGHPHFADGEQPPGDLVGPTRIDDRAWHQLAGVYDGVSAEFLYVDGQLAASTSSATVPLTGNGNDLLIGNDPDVALFQLFNGVVDEVSIFTNALSTAQVQQLFAAGGNAPPAPPAFKSITHIGNALLVTWSAVAGRNYQVQYKSSITQANWNNLGTALTATNTTASITDVTTDALRFYRVVLLP